MQQMMQIWAMQTQVPRGTKREQRMRRRKRGRTGERMVRRKGRKQMNSRRTLLLLLLAGWDCQRMRCVSRSCSSSCVTTTPRSWQPSRATCVSTGAPCALLQLHNFLSCSRCSRSRTSSRGGAPQAGSCAAAPAAAGGCSGRGRQAAGGGHAPGTAAAGGRC